MTDNNQDIPLCVDCDGTLISTDLLHEACFLLMKQYPLGLVLIPFWLLKGKAYLKEQLSKHVVFNWETLPYRNEIIALVREAKTNGRKVVLATASPKVWADGIANHLGLFDNVIATENRLNLSGKHKADHLASLYGEARFDYAGDTKADLHVWQKSRGAIVVSSNKHLLSHDHIRKSTFSYIVTPVKATLKTYIRAIRVHQWLKNLLVFVPLLAAHQFTSADALFQAGIAFMAFSLCASSVYVLNDLLDLESDRLHIRKCKRPFAASVIPLWQGTLMVPTLLLIAIGLSLLLPVHFIGVLSVYFLMTLAYSIRLKKQVIVDVMLLAGLYTMRIIAGGAATLIVPSFWLLAFSMFIFLSLALVKRYSEMLVTLQSNQQEAAGRGYSVHDLPVLMAIGSSSGMGAVLVLALYLNNPETNLMYQDKTWLWIVPALMLYWVSRMWMKTHRGEIDDDPVVFAVRDWQSIAILTMIAGLFYTAI